MAAHKTFYGTEYEIIESIRRFIASERSRTRYMSFYRLAYFQRASSISEFSCNVGQSFRQLLILHRIHWNEHTTLQFI